MLGYACPTPSSVAQTSALDSARTAYAGLDYVAAESILQRVLENVEAHTADQLTAAHQLYAFIAIAQNRPEVARRQFQAALTLDPDLDLDPVMVSPKITTFFQDVKRDFVGLGGTNGHESVIRYVRVADPRPAAAMRSAILPGWGQHYKGERRKAKVLLGAWATTATSVAITHVARGQAEDRYRNELDPDRVSARFKTLNRWHKTRNAAAVATGLLWVYGYVDALVSVPELGNRSLSVSPEFGPGAAGIRVVAQW